MQMAMIIRQIFRVPLKARSPAGLPKIKKHLSDEFLTQGQRTALLGAPHVVAEFAVVPRPALYGAYVLFIDLDTPLTLDIPTLPPWVFKPGRYAYCGSAYGPGGIEARVRRHLRPEKAVHWHVDHVTGAGRVTDAGARVGGRECDFLQQLLALPGAAIPVPGFGSSDCRDCPAHLVSLSAQYDFAALAPGLIPANETYALCCD